METVFIVLHVIIAVALVVIVLLQQGKGADAGAAFGAGSSSSLFGSLGAMPFLTKLTVALVALFFITSLSLAVLANKGASESFSISVPVEQKSDAPEQTQVDVMDLAKDVVKETADDVPVAAPVTEEKDSPK